MTNSDRHSLCTTFVLQVAFVISSVDFGARRTLSASDTVTIRVNGAVSGGPSLSIRVTAGSDDAGENTSAAVNLSSSDLELVHDSTDQTIGMRFNSGSGGHFAVVGGSLASGPAPPLRVIPHISAA